MVNDSMIAFSETPQAVKFNPRPIRGIIAAESPTESAILSIILRSSFFGKSAAMRQYPGITIIKGMVSTYLKGVVFKTGR
jgi:hypothetical protein